ncbi:MAG: hypothetical protein IKC04_02995 [Oscillospiraceae bacterium]|nr:hypothetical protein [Oscillospiraceae bacterium]MBR2896838.1 hypothetical protein [Oscillospiraceae bacterium]
MSDFSVVLILTDDTSKTGSNKPMMLQNIMGLPLLSWLTAALAADGCGRFFFICPEKFRAAAQACFPEGVDLTVAEETDVSDRLHVFLSTAEEEEHDVTVIAAPVVYLPGAKAESTASGAFRIDRTALMDALDERVSLHELRENGERPLTAEDGFFRVSDPAELADWQPLLTKSVLRRLVMQGVEIWDESNTYVAPDVFVGAGTVLLPGTILLRGTVVGCNCVIGPNSYIEHCSIADDTTVKSSQLYDSSVGAGTTVGPFAYLRPNSVIGANCRVGDFVEVKNSNIGDGTKISHLTYVGDSDVGRNVNFGCGTVTVNYDRAQKSRTVIGDDCFIGCNSNLVAPVKLGDGAYTAAGSTITDDVPPMALAIARERQTVKKDWASTHKLKKK